MPVLFDEQNSLVRQNGKHHHRARMRNHLAHCPNTARLNHFVASYPEDRALINSGAAQYFGPLGPGTYYGFLHIFVLVWSLEAHDTVKRMFHPSWHRPRPVCLLVLVRLYSPFAVT